MVLFIYLVLTLIIVSYFYVTRKFSYWKERGIPFDRAVPYLGNSTIFSFKYCLGEYIRMLYEKTDAPLIGFFLFAEPQLVVRDLKIIKAILIRDFHTFDNRTVLTNMKHDPIATQMLALVKNPEWKIIRQKMSTAFTSGKIKLMFPLMTDVGDDLLKYLKTNCEKPLDIKELTTRFSTDVITSCAFGIKAFSFEREDSDLFLASKRIMAFTWIRAIQPLCYFVAPSLVKLFRMTFLDPAAQEFLKNVFWKAVELRRQTTSKRNDLIDIFLEIEKTEDENETTKFHGDTVFAQALQFFLGGSETSSSSSCFALYELAKHPDIQQRLHEEVIETREKYNGVTYEAIQEMQYLDMVVNETLRKYPVIAFLDRRVNADYNIPGTNVRIEKGASVFIPIMGLHYDTNYFPEPNKFDPERFSPENSASRQNYTFLPFGEGPRNCIGSRFGLLTTKLFIFYVISEFEVLPTEKTMPYIKFNPTAFILSSKHVIPLQFKKRI